jgi:hypothetical protein
MFVVEYISKITNDYWTVGRKYFVYLFEEDTTLVIPDRPTPNGLWLWEATPRTIENYCKSGVFRRVVDVCR